MIERIKDRLAGFREESRYPNIQNSSVQYPLLIDDKALIEDATISGEVKIGAYSWVHHIVVLGGKVEIGRNTSINGPNTDIYCCLSPVIIGNYCSIARNVSIQEYNHKSNSCTSYFILHRVFGEDWVKEIESKGPIIIGSDVWIGAQSMILSGSQIGHGAVIGANSVVSSEIPPYAIVGGSPAKVIKYRFEQEIIDRLLEIKWWEWPYDKIKQNRELFAGELTLRKLDNICA